MAKQSNNNYPKSDNAGGSRVGRASQARNEAQVQQRAAEAIARQQATAASQGRGPDDTTYVSWYNQQQSSLPSPGETVE